MGGQGGARTRGPREILLQARPRGALIPKGSSYFFPGFTNFKVNRSLSPMASYFARSVLPSR